jgi:diguanylate cyclase (GGDEF)-like protein
VTTAPAAPATSREPPVRTRMLALAVAATAVVGLIDYLTGFEVSLSLLYLGPVALATWSSGRGAGIALSALSCTCWLAADQAAGHAYSYPAIPYWNALVRLGFFLTTALLIASLRASLREARQLARTDGLTGLHTRRAFEERLDHDLALSRRRGGAVTVVYVDLDRFKSVNDSRGHAAGDRALRTLAGALRVSIRQADTAARLGGDEFALILPDTDAEGARIFAADLEASLRGALAESEPRITCSIGVATVSGTGTSVGATIATADELMYAAKRDGGDRTVFGSGESGSSGRARERHASPPPAAPGPSAGGAGSGGV